MAEAFLSLERGTDSPKQLQQHLRATDAHMYTRGSPHHHETLVALQKPELMSEAQNRVVVAWSSH